MSSGVEIFQQLLNLAQGRNKMLTRHGAARLLKRIFGGFKVSGEGIEVTMKESGRLHLRALPAAVTSEATLHPFQVTGSKGTYTVQPGGIYTLDVDLLPQQFLAAAPFGLLLKDYVFQVSSNFTGHVVMTTEFDSLTGGAVLEIPWQVRLTNTSPNYGDQPLIRSNGENSPQNGIFTVIIADIVNGEVSSQRVTSSLAIFTIWNQIVLTRF